MTEGFTHHTGVSLNHSNEWCSESGKDVFPTDVIVTQRIQQGWQQVKVRSEIGSQLTQQHSGISCAFKAHNFIVTLERIKMRRLTKAFIEVERKYRQVLYYELYAAGSQQLTESHNMKQKRINSFLTATSSVGDIQLNSQMYQLTKKSQSLLKISKKNLSKQIFEYRLKVRMFEERIIQLENRLQQAQRRQDRQTIKKRQSLQSLAEELCEKNDVILQLKSIIKSLKAKMTPKQTLESPVLQQDCDSLRRSLLHIEGVNDRLNYDIAKIKESQRALQQQVKGYQIQNERLKEEINKLKQEIFLGDSLKNQLENSRKECVFWEKKLKTREERLTVLQKRINEIARNSEGQKYIAFCTEKRLKSQSIKEDTSPSMRQFELTSKIEAIFGFLFHIEDSTYELSSFELFDAQERQFLQFQKNKISKIMNCPQQQFNAINQHQQKQKKIAEDFGCTVLELIQRQSIPPKQQQGEITRLREKIGELKEVQLFVRSVLLSFIRSLQLRSIKKESQNILELLYDAFEYSEEERKSIFTYNPPTKNNKFFGIF